MRIIYCLLLALVVIAVDQFTKLLVIQHLAYGEFLPILPILNFTLAHNRGAAFSFLNQQSGWQIWFLGAIAVAVSVVILLWLRQLKAQEKLTAFALSLILGGALGNLIDRINHGYVVDFIDFHIKNWHFATFNIADSAICIGAALLLINLAFKRD